jgi:hypothetical protein
MNNIEAFLLTIIGSVIIISILYTYSFDASDSNKDIE